MKQIKNMNFERLVDVLCKDQLRLTGLQDIPGAMVWSFSDKETCKELWETTDVDMSREAISKDLQGLSPEALHSLYGHVFNFPPGRAKLSFYKQSPNDEEVTNLQNRFSFTLRIPNRR